MLLGFSVSRGIDPVRTWAFNFKLSLCLWPASESKKPLQGLTPCHVHIMYTRHGTAWHSRHSTAKHHGPRPVPLIHHSGHITRIGTSIEGERCVSERKVNLHVGTPKLTREDTYVGFTLSSISYYHSSYANAYSVWDTSSRQHGAQVFSDISILP